MMLAWLEVLTKLASLVGLVGQWKSWGGGYWPWAKPGLYEVLDYQVILTLHDRAGKKATYDKQERVRFLQEAIAYQDQAWGEGNLFATYQCSPGLPVDRYQEGHRFRILISLRETKQAGDIETFQIKRQIKQGFCQPSEYLQARFDHATQQAQLQVIFPLGYRPQRIMTLVENQSRHQLLRPEAIQVLPDGRQQATWKIIYPRLHETYTLRWDW